MLFALFSLYIYIYIYIYKKAICPLTGKKKKKKRDQVTVLALQSPHAQDSFCWAKCASLVSLAQMTNPFLLFCFPRFFLLKEIF